MDLKWWFFQSLIVFFSYGLGLPINILQTTWKTNMLLLSLLVHLNSKCSYVFKVRMTYLLRTNVNSHISSQQRRAVQQISISYYLPSQRLVLRGIVWTQPTDTELTISPSLSQRATDNHSLCCKCSIRYSLC